MVYRGCRKRQIVCKLNFTHGLCLWILTEVAEGDRRTDSPCFTYQGAKGGQHSNTQMQHAIARCPDGHFYTYFDYRGFGGPSVPSVPAGKLLDLKIVMKDRLVSDNIHLDTFFFFFFFMMNVPSL